MSVLRTEITAARLSGDVYQVTAAGELDLHDADALADAIAQAKADGATRVLVDLTGVSFLDSTILGVLVGAARRLEALVLAIGDIRVLRVLEITGLDRKLRVERSLSEALAVLATNGSG